MKCEPALRSASCQDLTGGKQLVKVGVKFDAEQRTLGEWIVVKG